VTREPQIWLAFGCESRGLDEKILLAHPDTVVRIPMLEGMRSLNLSNAVAIAVYEVLRRTGGQGLLKTGRFPGRDNA
jgi:tRNA (cytidine/uridine-2'-O-)-methyltransferase